MRLTATRVLVLTAYAATAAAGAGKTTTTGSFPAAKPWGREPVTAFEWAPDGKHFAYCGGQFSPVSGETQLWMFDADSGAGTLLIAADRLAAHLGGSCRIEWHPASKALLVAGSREALLVDAASGSFRAVVTSKSAALESVRFSPDGHWISYVTAGKLVARPIHKGAVRRIAESSAGTLRGEPDWLYRHKLGMDVAYWWSPDSASIAYLETDRMEAGKLFPVAGDALPRIRVCIASLSAPGTLVVVDLPAGEAYLPQVVWTPDSRHLAIQRLERAQTRLELLLADASTGKAATLLSETDAYWINADPHGAHFVGDGKRFLWTSERTGFRHMFLYELTADRASLAAQVTHGDWEVTSIEAADDHAVFFTSTRQSPLERQVERVELTASGGTGVTQLTSQAGWHSTSFSPAGNGFLDLFSSATGRPALNLIQSGGREIAINGAERTELLPVEFSTVRTHDGLVLNTMLIRPARFDAARKYPAIILAPAGPRAQTVRNAFDSEELEWAQEMARRGFVVFAADGRGSGGRGRRFEEPIHYRLGGMELPDQLDALVYLRHMGFVDMKRLGIWGSQYAGMIALGGMMHSHGIYRAGVADSPITDWTAVDVLTAERYLGPMTPEAVSYSESSPNEFAKKLEGQLLVVADPEADPLVGPHLSALKDELEETHKLRPGRASIEQVRRSRVFERAGRFFAGALAP